MAVNATTFEQALEQWGEPYFPVSLFYKRRYGSRAQTLPVTLASDCPNRRGLKGMKTCVFCDPWGSAAYPELQGLGLKQQIDTKWNALTKRYATSKVLIYFQSYSSTFLAVRKIHEAMELALSYPEVQGVVLGTRPDCFSPALYSSLTEFSKKTDVYVELGVQTFDEEQLKFLRRGHTGEDSKRAIMQIFEKTGIEPSLHLMLGLPGETVEDVVRLAKTVSSLPVSQVKLHNLHVLRNTELENVYNQGEFEPASLEIYAKQVRHFLQHLDKRIAVQRLTALSSHWDQLIAPEWNRHKMKPRQYILDEMRQHRAYQGQML